ncbi:TIGR02206 family membrane protein [Texcoconibacillus texcoconensis]|uniref:Putative integral membrane protein (TIGR02206 family) n=1 Tax=Texcoconibacillus texcoconensis TaxID=1095777 RepID=A0A840QQN2_9BACI|nr:putative integral membrane protein (TIGR02206 family) [Texcoconibacillus texcoconensis]
MSWFHGRPNEIPFSFYGWEHWFAWVIFILIVSVLYIYRHWMRSKDLRKVEIVVALSLIGMEGLYHLWLFFIGSWDLRYSLPLELSSISVILAVLLLLFRKRIIYELLFFVGIAGALQALLTPVLTYGFPHFRYVHFFYTHMMVIWVALYFTWVVGYRPTIRSVFKSLIFLNILLPIVWFTNSWAGGNYMFLQTKPESPNLLDFLGPHPWYIISLEIVALVLFLLLWLLFRERSMTR